jgi:hypothetical protein
MPVKKKCYKTEAIAIRVEAIKKKAGKKPKRSGRCVESNEPEAAKKKKK